ncbi:hypothetical protein BDR07DRAFT_1408150 [Suillus spraguei]|nr:hypothetical protein BDR07DRAFT_1408150 [Suillus spraguei]
MGIFLSAALFELTVVIITVYHSLTLRFAGIRTINRLVSKLWKGSLLYALSLLGMSFGSLFLLSISIANIVSFSLPVCIFIYCAMIGSKLLVQVSSGQSGIVDVCLHGVMASRILFDLREANRREDKSQPHMHMCVVHFWNSNG